MRPCQGARPSVDRARDVAVVGDQRPHQAAPAARGQRDRLVDGVVGHHGADRAERLHVVRLDRALRGAQQHGGEEGATLGVAVDEVDVVGVAEDDVRGRAQRLDRLADLLALAEARERTHADALVAGAADADLRQAGGDRLDDVVGDRGRHDRAPDRSALLAGLDRHLGHDALDEQVELGVVDAHVGPEHGAVEGVCLDAELDTAVQHVGVGAQHARGVGRAGERDRVLHLELVEQPRRAAGEQLERALGEDAGLDDPTYDELGEVGRLAGRLDDRGHPGEEGRGELLEHAPDREVEGVDLHRDAGPRGVDVLPDEGAAATELLEPAVEDDGVVGQLAHALAGEAEQGAEAAVDVDHRVALGRAGAQRQGVELVLVGAEVLGELLDEAGALVEGQRPAARDRRPCGRGRASRRGRGRCSRSGRPRRRCPRRAAGCPRRWRGTSVRRRSSPAVRARRAPLVGVVRRVSQ